jgi:hypothetical protein
MLPFKNAPGINCLCKYIYIYIYIIVAHYFIFNFFHFKQNFILAPEHFSGGGTLPEPQAAQKSAFAIQSI